MAEERAAIVRLVIDNDEPPDDDGRGGGGGGGGDGYDSVPGPEQAPFGSDDYLAVQLSAWLGRDWRSTPDMSWRHWTGQRWEEERSLRVMALSRLSSRKVALGLDNAKMRRDLTARSRIYSAVTLAAADRAHMTPTEAFDADPWVLNTPDGIVNLRDGQLRPHDPEALLTRMTAAGAAGEAPRFKAFLDQATGGDVQLQGFLQRVVGYCLTGSIEQHAIFFLYDNGIGGTGKSTFVTVISELLADYATVAPMDMFTVATGERHPAEMAILHNVRLVTASETEEGRRWDESKLKAITGGDPITARFMRGNFFTFRPMFKLLMSGNHRPRMRSADSAMRRRFHMIPFVHRPETPDLELLEKLRAEFPGILRWAIQGELERHRIGLAPPPAVVSATDEYFQNENAIGRWIEERCLLDVNLSCATRAAYQDFKSWAATAGEFVGSERVFSQKLQQQPGVDQYRTNKARGFRGVGLRSATAELPLNQPPTGGGGRPA